VNLGLTYQWRPNVQFTLDAGNLFNEPQVLYRGFAHRMSTTILNGTTLTFGVNGRF
jgi:outer membrane receptor protein involved in Fe transport